MSGLELLKKCNIPNKPDFVPTTSHKFKLDVYDFFKDFNDKILVEFGTSRGFTSAFCSHFFKEVHTINSRDSEETKEYLSDYKNVYQHKFVLGRRGHLHYFDNIPAGDVYVIDAVHAYGAIMADTETVKSHGNKGAYLIYDDYGSYPDIKRAVNYLIELKKIKLIKYIGEDTGWLYGPGTLYGSERILKDKEGVICQIL